MKSSAVAASDKERLAIAEITDDFPAIALIFKNKKGGGMLLTTKTQSYIAKFFPISVTINDELANEEECSENESYGLIVGGVGNYAEFQIVRSELNEIVRNQIYNDGLHTNSTEEIIIRFAKFMNDEYRSDSSISPYRVELIVIGLLEEIKMFRVKYDGDYHPAEPYCVIGGYKRVGKETIRRKALRMLKTLYNKRIPSLTTCQKVAREILALDKKQGYYQEIIPFSWSEVIKQEKQQSPD